MISFRVRKDCGESILTWNWVLKSFFKQRMESNGFPYAVKLKLLGGPFVKIKIWSRLMRVLNSERINFIFKHRKFLFLTWHRLVAHIHGDQHKCDYHQEQNGHNHDENRNLVTPAANCFGFFQSLLWVVQRDNCKETNKRESIIQCGSAAITGEVRRRYWAGCWNFVVFLLLLHV